MTVAFTVGRETAASYQRVVLARGQHAEVAFVLVPSSLAGVVVDSVGKPVGGAGMSAQSDGLDGTLFARADEHGQFTLGGLPPGRYELTARRPWSQNGPLVDGPAVEVTTTNRRVTLVVPDLAGITRPALTDDSYLPYD